MPRACRLSRLRSPKHPRHQLGFVSCGQVASNTALHTAKKQQLPLTNCSGRHWWLPNISPATHAPTSHGFRHSVASGKIGSMEVRRRILGRAYIALVYGCTLIRQLECGGCASKALRPLLPNCPLDLGRCSQSLGVLLTVSLSISISRSRAVASAVSAIVPPCKNVPLLFWLAKPLPKRVLVFDATAT